MNSISHKTILVMAGGTGGHIFPGLAVANHLRQKGWHVTWLGNRGGMEYRLVTAENIPFEAIQFGGLRGKGMKTMLLLPLNLLRAFMQSIAVLRRVKPHVVLGMGGYVTFPAGMMSVLLGKPLVLHEQNSIAGLANKVLAKVADRVLCAFPKALPNAQWLGNPLRSEMTASPNPEQRYKARTGPLKILVVGGSLGAQALNQLLPEALALIAEDQRPQVIHQAGEKNIADLQARYQALGVTADLRPFINDIAKAYAEADLVICRAGAMTVAEIAAVGVAAYFVPFPHAVDDHQTTNAKFLVDAGAAKMCSQKDLSAPDLAHYLQTVERTDLLAMASLAHTLAKPQATHDVAAVCEEVSL